MTLNYFQGHSSSKTLKEDYYYFQPIYLMKTRLEATKFIANLSHFTVSVQFANWKPWPNFNDRAVNRSTLSVDFGGQKQNSIADIMYLWITKPTPLDNLALFTKTKGIPSPDGCFATVLVLTVSRVFCHWDIQYQLSFLCWPDMVYIAFQSSPGNILTK